MTNELYVMFAVVAVVGLLLCILGIMLFNHIQTSDKRMYVIVKELTQNSAKLDFLNVDINVAKDELLNNKSYYTNHIDRIVKYVDEQSENYSKHFTEIEKTYSEIAKNVNLYVSDFTDSNNNTKMLIKGMNDHICALASQLRETRGVNLNIELGVSETIDRLEEVREILIDTHEIFDSNHKLMKAVTKGTAKTLVKLDKIHDDVEKSTGTNFVNLMNIHNAVAENTNKQNDLSNFVIESDKARHKQIKQLSEDVDNVKILNLENHNGGLELIGAMNDLVISTIKDHTDSIINRVNSLDVTICGEFVDQDTKLASSVISNGKTLYDIIESVNKENIKSNNYLADELEGIKANVKHSSANINGVINTHRDNIVEVVNKSTKISEHKMIELAEIYMNEFKTFATDNKVDIQNHALELNTKSNNLMQNSFVKDINNKINSFAQASGIIAEETTKILGFLCENITSIGVRPGKMTMWGLEDAEKTAIMEKAFSTPRCCKNYKSCTCATDFAGMYDETTYDPNKDDEVNTDDVVAFPVGDDGISENTPYEALQAVMPDSEQVTPENKESVANERKRGKNGRFTKSVDNYKDVF